MRFFAALLVAMFLQIPAFASNNISITSDNVVELLSHASQYARITGTVSSVDLTGKSKVIFLNFGKNFNTSFSAIIYDNIIPSFVLAGISDPEEYFKNKTVILEGIIRLSNGKPEMVIDSPDQIKVIDRK